MDLSPTDRVRRLLATASHMTVATADGDGRPWVSPVFFVPDDDRNLLWVSDKEARHATNLRARAEVAIEIHAELEGRLDAVYFEAHAVALVDEEEVRAGIDVMRRRPQPARWTIDDIADVTGHGPWRIHRATPTSASVRAVRTKAAKPVAVREPAEP